MNYHVLKLFYYVAITGSVTKASERLHISQPAISAQIRKFERENHILLFEIKGKRMVLTPLGKRLIEPLEKFFAMGDQVQQIIEDYHKFPEGICGLQVIVGDKHPHSPVGVIIQTIFSGS